MGSGLTGLTGPACWVSGGSCQEAGAALHPKVVFSPHLSGSTRTASWAHDEGASARPLAPALSVRREPELRWPFCPSPDVCLLTGGLVRTWGGRVQSLDWRREQDAALPCQVRAVRDSRAVISVRLSISAPWSTPRLPPSRPTRGQLCCMTAAQGCWSRAGVPGPVNTRVHICVQTGVHLSWVDSCTGPSPSVESGALSASVVRASHCGGSSFCGA